MDISEAKKISIVDYLENMGYTHAKIRRGQYWYRSPLREEKSKHPMQAVLKRLQ